MVYLVRIYLILQPEFVPKCYKIWLEIKDSSLDQLGLEGSTCQKSVDL